VAYRKKYNEDFIFAAHWNGVHMLQEAMRRAKSTDPKTVAFALEGASFKSPLGEVEMRKTDHQLIQPLYVLTLVKSAAHGGPKEAKIDMEGSGLAPITNARLEAYTSAQPTSCNMTRP
jgi:branched-chain amino acid transport system substrate-binding protein